MALPEPLDADTEGVAEHPVLGLPGPAIAVLRSSTKVATRNKFSGVTEDLMTRAVAGVKRPARARARHHLSI